jgi:ribose-phosphate pyrophosphokinase
LIEKRRGKKGDKTEAINLVGDVTGKDVLLVDDEVDTGGSVVQAVELLKVNGAEKIYLVFVHPVLSNKAAEKMAGLPFEEIICTDTVPISDKDLAILGDKLRILSVAPLLGEVILRAHEGRSVGEMFNE